MKQLTILMAPLVISSFSSWSRPLSPPSRFRRPPDPPPPMLPSMSPESPFEAFSPPKPPFGILSPPESSPEALFPSDLPPEVFFPPEPPDPPLSPTESPDPSDAHFSIVSLLLLETSCAFSQPVSKAPNLESCLLNMAFVLCDEVASLVYVSDTRFVSKRWYPPDGGVVLCSVPISIFASLPRPPIQVLSQRLSSLMLGDELISLFWNFGLCCGLILYPVLVRPITAVCSPITAICSLIFVVLKSFQLWQLNGLMLHISSVMEFVHLPISSSSLCGFGAESIVLKIRETSITEVLIKSFVVLKTVDYALAAASILGLNS